MTILRYKRFGTYRPTSDPKDAIRSRGIIINDMSNVYISNGKSWLQSLNYVVVIK